MQDVKDAQDQPQTRKESPKWSPKAKDVEKLILELSADGKSSSEIGIILRDMHGVPSVKLATGKSISSVLSDQVHLPLYQKI